MMSRTIFRILCVAAAASLCGCGTIGLLFRPKNPPKTTAKDGPELVGRIASIPADKSFVLIQSYGKWNISSNTTLTSRGADQRSANLLVTGERLGQFAAADIKSGTVAVGDAVYSFHEPAPEPSSPPEKTSQTIDNQGSSKP